MSKKNPNSNNHNNCNNRGASAEHSNKNMTKSDMVVAHKKQPPPAKHAKTRLAHKSQHQQQKQQQHQNAKRGSEEKTQPPSKAMPSSSGKKPKNGKKQTANAETTRGSIGPLRFPPSYSPGLGNSKKQQEQQQQQAPSMSKFSKGDGSLMKQHSNQKNSPPINKAENKKASNKNNKKTGEASHHGQVKGHGSSVDPSNKNKKKSSKKKSASKTQPQQAGDMIALNDDFLAHRHHDQNIRFNKSRKRKRDDTDDTEHERNRDIRRHAASSGSCKSPPGRRSKQHNHDTNNNDNSNYPPSLGESDASKKKAKNKKKKANKDSKNGHDSDIDRKPRSAESVHGNNKKKQKIVNICLPTSGQLQQWESRAPWLMTMTTSTKPTLTTTSHQILPPMQPCRASLPPGDPSSGLPLSWTKRWQQEPFRIQPTASLRNGDVNDDDKDKDSVRMMEQFNEEVWQLADYVRLTEAERVARQSWIDRLQTMACDSFTKQQPKKYRPQQHVRFGSRAHQDAHHDDRVRLEVFGSFATPAVCCYISDVDVALWGVVANHSTPTLVSTPLLQTATSTTTTIHPPHKVAQLHQQQQSPPSRETKKQARVDSWLQALLAKQDEVQEPKIIPQKHQQQVQQDIDSVVLHPIDDGTAQGVCVQPMERPPSVHCQQQEQRVADVDNSDDGKSACAFVIDRCGDDRAASSAVVVSQDLDTTMVTTISTIVEEDGPTPLHDTTSDAKKHKNHGNGNALSPGVELAEQTSTFANGDHEAGMQQEQPKHVTLGNAVTQSDVDAQPHLRDLATTANYTQTSKLLQDNGASNAQEDMTVAGPGDMCYCNQVDIVVGTSSDAILSTGQQTAGELGRKDNNGGEDEDDVTNRRDDGDQGYASDQDSADKMVSFSTRRDSSPKCSDPTMHIAIVSLPSLTAAAAGDMMSNDDGAERNDASDVDNDIESAHDASSESGGSDTDGDDEENSQAEEAEISYLYSTDEETDDVNPNNDADNSFDAHDSNLEVSFFSSQPPRSNLAPSAFLSMGPSGETRRDVLDALSSMSRVVRRVMRGSASIQFIRRARVPIIKVDSRGELGFQIDIAVGGNNCGADTSYYAASQAERYSSFAPVVLALKVLLAQHSLDIPFNGGLGSYKLYVLLAYHLEKHLALGGADRPGEVLLSFLFRYGQVSLSYDEEEDVGGARTILEQHVPLYTTNFDACADLSNVFLLEDCICLFRATWQRLRQRLVETATQRRSTNRNNLQQRSRSILAAIVDSEQLKQQRERCLRLTRAYTGDGSSNSSTSCPAPSNHGATSKGGSKRSYMNIPTNNTNYKRRKTTSSTMLADRTAEEIVGGYAQQGQQQRQQQQQKDQLRRGGASAASISDSDETDKQARSFSSLQSLRSYSFRR